MASNHYEPDIAIPLAHQFMKTNLITFTTDQEIFHAIDTLLKNKISGAPVVAQDKTLLGILSEKDCMHLFLNGTFRHMTGGTVGDYMSQVVTVVQPDDNLYQIAGIFASHTIRRLPVVKDSRLVGQISRRDLLEASRTLWDRFRENRERPDPEYHLTDALKAALVNRSKEFNASHIAPHTSSGYFNN